MPRATRKRAAAAAAVEEQQPDEMEVDVDEAEVTAAVEEQEDGGEEDDAGDKGGDDAGLQNNEPLTWRAGRPIPVGTLLPRLQALSEELQTFDQGVVDRSILEPKAKELANVQLLGHKDYGIRIHTLECIVEMFRLLAPDAPYKSSQLGEIFRFIVGTVIPAFGDPNHTYNGVQSSIIKSLANVKSIILIQDTPGADKLMGDLFKACFDVLAENVRGGNKELLSKNVEFDFTLMLCALIEDMQALPNDVTEAILAQFLRADPNATVGKKGEQQLSEVLKEVSPAYNMARSVCNTCEEKTSRAIGQYFNSVLIDASEVTGTAKPSKSKGKKSTHDESEDEDESGIIAPPSDDDLKEVRKAHRLLLELWRSCPSVIRNVIPQIEAETGTENVPLRVMAVESIGDMISGIGAAGPPPPITLDPAAYPSQSLDTYAAPVHKNILLTPAAPQAFSAAYPSAYQAFFDRHRDKSAHVRTAWATAVGRIILTAGGGKGLDTDQETALVRCFADMLSDNDERVRLATVQAIAQFDFQSILYKLGRFGGVNKEGSVLCNLAIAVKDQKPSISKVAVELTARIWGVASGAIVEGDERIRELFGALPTKILGAIFVNRKELTKHVHEALFESLLPVGFPPIKSKKDAAGNSQQSAPEHAAAADKIRVLRILAFVRDLEERCMSAFFAMQAWQVSRAKYVISALEMSERFGSSGKSNVSSKEKEQRVLFIKTLTTPFSEDNDKTAQDQLTKFLDHFDRRNYSLAKFVVQSDSDYKKVNNALKELNNRVPKEAPSSIAACMGIVIHTLRLSAPLVYNRSHVPAIVDISRTDESGLGHTAHVVLKEISAKAPLVFENHVKELCETLKKQAPSKSSGTDSFAEDTLKACAGFARQFPDKMPKDRDFYQAMTKFAKYGSPPTVAKHAVTTIMVATNKKEMYAKEILKHCLTNFDAGTDDALSKLAAVGQLRLLANKQTEDQHEAVSEVLSSALKNRTGAEHGDDQWLDEVDDELSAKLLALKAIVNNVRGQIPADDADEPTEQLKHSAKQVFAILNTIIEQDGQLAGKGMRTPTPHKTRLRLAASKLILKLCCYRALDRVFTAADLNRLTTIAQDPQIQVRGGFNAALKKYLGQGKLNRRFYPLMFLYAFEPEKTLKESTTTFLRARAAKHAKEGDQMMVGIFANLLSLLAHHQDFAPTAADLEDFIDYIIFYLKIVATEKNLPTVYAIAQKAKTVEDLVPPENDENLYTLSDLATAIIRHYEQFQGWSMQIISDKTPMPRPLYRPSVDRERAQEVSANNYVPDELAENLEDMVRQRMRSKKKRKSGDVEKRATKKARPSSTDEKALPIRKAPKRERKAPKPGKTPRKRVSDEIPTSERRKSARVSNAQTYAEESDSDEAEFDRWQADDSSNGEEGEDEEANKENVVSSTPPTSDPMPAVAGASANGTKEKTSRSTPKPTPKGKGAKEKPQFSKKAAAEEELPKRSGRATRNTKKKEKDAEHVYDIPDEMET